MSKQNPHKSGQTNDQPGVGSTPNPHRKAMNSLTQAEHLE